MLLVFVQNFAKTFFPDSENNTIAEDIVPVTNTTTRPDRTIGDPRDDRQPGGRPGGGIAGPAGGRGDPGGGSP